MSSEANIEMHRFAHGKLLELGNAVVPLGMLQQLGVMSK